MTFCCVYTFFHLYSFISFAIRAGLRTEARWVSVNMNCIHYDSVGICQYVFFFKVPMT